MILSGSAVQVKGLGVRAVKPCASGAPLRGLGLVGIWDSHAGLATEDGRRAPGLGRSGKRMGNIWSFDISDRVLAVAEYATSGWRSYPDAVRSRVTKDREGVARQTVIVSVRASLILALTLGPPAAGRRTPGDDIL